MPVARKATSIAEVVTSGLCIGCGLCESITGGRIAMVMTGAGSLRPAPADRFTPDEEDLLLAACPGVVAAPRPAPDLEADPVWGAFSTMRYGWAGDPDVRFRAATGGVLTALGMHLINDGIATSVLHVGADPERPMRSRWLLSRTADEVLTNTGSRYGPTAPLAGLGSALDRAEPFAIIAKPCDLGALHAHAASDPRVDDLCVARLALVCGGQSRLEKSTDVLAEVGVDEAAVSLFRYRGYGNPGPTRVGITDGRSFEKTYLEMWEDEAGWKVENRCKICPDALGEAADVAAADVWSGGVPTDEDEGFNGIIVRTPTGEALVRSAVEAGALVLGEPIDPREFDELQPHQVRKKEALASRFAGLTEAGIPVISTTGLRVGLLGQRLEPEARRSEEEGTLRRAAEGRFAEPLPTSRPDRLNDPG